MDIQNNVLHRTLHQPSCCSFGGWKTADSAEATLKCCISIPGARARLRRDAVRDVRAEDSPIPYFEVFSDKIPTTLARATASRRLLTPSLP
jgi:hypothetical protein